VLNDDPDAGLCSASSDLCAPCAAQLVTLGLEFDGPFRALARLGGLIVFGGHREALPDVVNRDIDALAGFKESCCCEPPVDMFPTHEGLG